MRTYFSLVYVFVRTSGPYLQQIHPPLLPLVVYDRERALPSQHEVARGQDATDPVAEAATAKTEVSEL